MGSNRKQTRRLESVKKYYIIKDDYIRYGNKQVYTVPESLLEQLKGLSFDDFKLAFTNLKGIINQDLERCLSDLNNHDISKSERQLVLRLKPKIDSININISNMTPIANFLMISSSYNRNYVSYSIIPCDSIKS